jgi:hypothetical protein
VNDEVKELRKMIAAQNVQIQALIAASNHSSKPVLQEEEETGFTQSYAHVWRPGKRDRPSTSGVACGQKREREPQMYRSDYEYDYEYARLFAESSEDERARRVRLETMRAQGRGLPW